jgi:putative transposase
MGFGVDAASPLCFKGGDPIKIGPLQLITYKMRMPAPYCFHAKMPKKNNVRPVEGGYKEIPAALCGCKHVDIIAGAVCSDHIHLHASIPPKMAASEFMGRLKGKSALAASDRHPELAGKWSRGFWAAGCHVSAAGKDEEKIRKHIAEQQESDRKKRQIYFCSMTWRHRHPPSRRAVRCNSTPLRRAGSPLQFNAFEAGK